jgi:hypothetical protein
MPHGVQGATRASNKTHGVNGTELGRTRRSAKIALFLAASEYYMFYFSVSPRGEVRNVANGTSVFNHEI